MLILMVKLSINVYECVLVQLLLFQITITHIAIFSLAVFQLYGGPSLLHFK